MKRRILMIVDAFLIMMFVMNIIRPLRVEANPGNVVISGQVTYQPRNWNPQQNNWGIGRDLKIELYEEDLYGRDWLLDTTYTDGFGNFTFPSRTNWWVQDNRQLNIYFVIVTTANTNTSVTDRLFGNYTFRNVSTFLSHDGIWTINFPVTSGWQDYRALWIFEDIRNAWNYVHNNYYRNGVQFDPGNVTAIWEGNVNCFPFQLPDFLNIPCGSFSYGGIIIPHFIFVADNTNNSMDVVAHETGHMYMINANGLWYTGCPLHYLFSTSSANCAWPEGWADFFPLIVNGDQCYNYLENPCSGQADGDYYNLEIHSRADNDLIHFPWGDSVEGRVAAALYDLYDSNNEGFDSMFTGFSPIADITLGNSQINTFHDFWNNWAGGNGTAHNFYSGLTLWWNTINYTNIRQVYLPVIAK